MHIKSVKIEVQSWYFIDLIIEKTGAKSKCEDTKKRATLGRRSA